MEAQRGAGISAYDGARGTIEPNGRVTGCVQWAGAGRRLPTTWAMFIEQLYMALALCQALRGTNLTEIDETTP